MINPHNILFEDNHLLILNKENGVLTQADITGDECLLDKAKAYIKKAYNKPGAVYLHPVSRIDRPASGAIVFARTSKALSRMTVLIKERRIKKIYTAIVTGIIDTPEQKLINYLLKSEKKNVVRVVQAGTEKAKKAVLQYRKLCDIAENSALSVNLETGRPHQIRVQLSHLGHPIVGDFKYGYQSSREQYFIYLHCRQLEFIHPVTKSELTIDAPYPNKPLWHELIKA